MLTVIRFLRAISTIDLTQQDYRKILLIVLARDMLCICTNNYYRAYFVSFNYFIATHIVHNVHTSIAALHSHTFAHTVRPVLSMKFRGKIAMLTSLSHGTARHIGNNTICIPNRINHIQILFEWFCLL